MVVVRWATGQPPAILPMGMQHRGAPLGPPPRCSSGPRDTRRTPFDEIGSTFTEDSHKASLWRRRLMMRLRLPAIGMAIALLAAACGTTTTSTAPSAAASSPRRPRRRQQRRPRRRLRRRPRPRRRARVPVRVPGLAPALARSCALRGLPTITTSGIRSNSRPATSSSGGAASSTRWSRPRPIPRR